uniref:Uncharacterized protein n=1 Tax=Molossus molossus TaxID=27622 RepID=A0A7J8BYB8_MOLMO|nr:hypothetical protein HJG59_010007 [Molossus molossus]
MLFQGPLGSPAPLLSFLSISTSRPRSDQARCLSCSQRHNLSASTISKCPRQTYSHKPDLARMSQRLLLARRWICWRGRGLQWEGPRHKQLREPHALLPSRWRGRRLRAHFILSIPTDTHQTFRVAPLCPLRSVCRASSPQWPPASVSVLEI